MPENAEPKNNSERLLTHLEAGSLAHLLVRAHCDRDIANPAESMESILRERLKRVRGSIDDPEA